MARQHVHNRRAGRGSGGSSWISYSDIMAALVMVFVLFLVYSLYHYGEAIRIQTNLLEDQRKELAERQQIVIIQQGKLDSQSAENDALRLALAAGADPRLEGFRLFDGAVLFLCQLHRPRPL